MQREDTFFPQKILKKFLKVRLALGTSKVVMMSGCQDVRLSRYQVVKMSGCPDVRLSSFIPGTCLTTFVFKSMLKSVKLTVAGNQ